VGLLTIIGWAVIGLIVAAVDQAVWPEEPGRATDRSTALKLCVGGAILGAFIGQTFGWFVFGQPLGFVCSVAGAILLLSIYRSRRKPAPASGSAPQFPGIDATLPAYVRDTTGGAFTSASDRRTSTVTATPSERPKHHAGVRFIEALGWGAVCAVAAAISGFLGFAIASTLYPQLHSGFPIALLIIPFGMILGFLAAATTRLVRPLWTAAPMSLTVIGIALVYGALILNWGRGNAREARVIAEIEPEPVIALPCDATLCAPADPPMQWTIQGDLRLQETAGLGGTVNEISITSSPEGKPFKGSVSGPMVYYRAGQIPGTRRVRSGEVNVYPIRYSYRTNNGFPRRTISVGIQFTDRAGHFAYGLATWHVR
jgi:uncharacterized membrane protein YeaQ/YmgE (transglycosylase-associated protein family)